MLTDLSTKDSITKRLIIFPVIKEHVVKSLIPLIVLSLTACAKVTSINGIPTAISDPAEYARILNQIDSNQDKSITAAEIKASGVDPGESILYSQTKTVAAGQTAEKYIELYDSDYDQKLSPIELKAYAYVPIFKSIDTNKDGAWQKSELMAPGHSFSGTEQQVTDTMKGLDLNKDDKVTFEEFSTTGEKMAKQALSQAGTTPTASK